MDDIGVSGTVLCLAANGDITDACKGLERSGTGLPKLAQHYSWQLETSPSATALRDVDDPLSYSPQPLTPLWQSMPVLPPSASRLSLSMDYPGYEQLLRPGTFRQRRLQCRTASFVSPSPLCPSAPSTPIIDDPEAERGTASSLLRSSRTSPQPPGLALDSICGVRAYASVGIPTSSNCDTCRNNDADGRAGGARSGHNNRTSIDAAAGAEVLTSCVGVVPVSAISPEGRTGASAPSVSILARAAAATSTASAPGRSAVPPCRPLAPFSFDSDIELARLQTRFAALDAHKEVGYEAPSNGGVCCGSKERRGSCGPTRGGGGAGLGGKERHSNGKAHMGGRSCNRNNRDAPAAGAGGGRGATHKASSVWSSFLGLTCRMPRLSPDGGCGGSGSGSAAISSRNSRRTPAGIGGGGTRVSTGWVRYRQLLWRGRPKKRSPPTGRPGVVSANVVPNVSFGYSVAGGSDNGSLRDSAEWPLPLVRSRDSRLLHRVRLGLDVRPPELDSNVNNEPNPNRQSERPIRMEPERSLSVFSVARNEDGGLLCPPAPDVQPSRFVGVAAAVAACPPRQGSLARAATFGRSSSAALASVASKDLAGAAGPVSSVSWADPAAAAVVVGSAPVSAGSPSGRWLWLRRKAATAAREVTAADGGGGGGGSGGHDTGGLATVASGRRGLEELFTPVIHACEVDCRASTAYGMLETPPSSTLQATASLPAVADNYRLGLGVGFGIGVGVVGAVGALQAARNVRCMSQSETVVRSVLGLTEVAATPQQPTSGTASSMLGATTPARSAAAKFTWSFRAGSIWPVSSQSPETSTA